MCRLPCHILNGKLGPDMIEQQIVATRVKMDRNTVLQNSWHDRVRWRGNIFLRQVTEERAVARLKGFSRRMNRFLDQWLVEVGHEFVLRWCRAACVVDVVDTEAAKCGQMLLHGHFDIATYQGFV